MQRTKPGAAYGGGGAEICNVPLRSGLDLSRRIPCAFRRTGGAYAGGDCSRGECPGVCAESKQGLGGKVPGNLPCQGWNSAHGELERTWPGSSSIISNAKDYFVLDARPFLLRSELPEYGSI